MTRQTRNAALYVSCTKQQRAAVERLATRQRLSIAAFITKALGRKFWIEVDKEVLRTTNGAAQRNRGGDDR